MQDLLPLGIDADLRQLLKSADTIIGPNARADATIGLMGPATVLVAGTVRNVSAPDGVVVVAAGGRITGAVQARMMILLGRVEPDSGANARIVCEHVITGKDSIIIDADVLYTNMVTHQKAVMRRVSLDQIDPEKDHEDPNHSGHPERV